jgi:surface antigen
MKAHTLCRQTRIVRILRMIMVSTSLCALAACSGIHLNDLTASAPQPVAASETMDSAPGAITGSVAPSGSLGYAGSEHTDWDLVLATVNTSLSAPPTARIEWSNKSTGDSGTITELTPIAAKKPRDCRAFSTTIASVDGVRLYHAEVCKSFMNTWEFAKLIAADSG